MKAEASLPLPRTTSLPDEALSSSDAREVFREILTLHARTLRSRPFLHMVFITSVVFACHDFVPPARLYGWSIGYLTAEVIRGLVATAVLRRITDIDPYQTHHLFVGLAAFNGLIAGSSALLIMPFLPVLLQALLIASLYLLISGACSVASSTQAIYLTYAISLLFLVLVGWSKAYPDFMWVAIAKAIAYSAYVMSVARDGERSLLRSVTIRRDRDRVVRDLHRRNEDVRAAMNRAEHAAASRSRVLASASHDLRQPMHALSIYSAILAEKPAPETLNDVGQNIQQIVQSLGSLLDGLLDLSRLSTEHYVPDRTLFSADTIVQAICSEYQPRAAAKGLTLTEQTAPLRIFGDPMAFSRITRNLLDNAIKYTEHGSVGITLRASREDAILTIEDSGVGIAASEQTHVFEEFYQANNPARDRTKGVGLGLTIVQRLCELMQAHVHLSSQPDRGTRFEITIPGLIDEASRTSATQSGDKQTRSMMAGRTLFIVDDEIDVRLSMLALLRSWGATVYLADSGTSLTTLLKTHGRPDLLISDLRLSGVEDGAALASRLRARFGDFPVLIMTGDTSSTLLSAANATGYPLLQKPIPADRLRQVIDSLLPEATSAPSHVIDQQNQEGEPG